MRFFLVDRVDELRPGEVIRGVKNVTLSEDFLQDHFPTQPLFPGTLMIEALAQLGGCLVEATFNTSDDDVRRAILAQVDKAKFHEAVRPGDQLSIVCRLVWALEGAARVKGEARVGEREVARATLLFVLRAVGSERVHRQRREIYEVWTRHLNLGFTLR
jgi:3-hydroxyacyl-[acyl-carrier-protein] dehydratase